MSKHDETYDVKLTYSELLLLDGKTSEKAQAIIDVAKKENSIGFELPIMNEVITEAEKLGKLTWRHDSGRSCRYCDKSYDYARYKRSSRFHNKGDQNYEKPLYYRGIQFNTGFVVTTGTFDMCLDCLGEQNVLERIIHYIVDNDLKIEIQKNKYVETKYLKDDKRVCYSCKEGMYESEMGRQRAMMGGTYPCNCPKCGAGSDGRESHKITDDFRHILNPEHGKVFIETE